jgi:outer membrane lipoprotein-sorting protein
MSLQANSSTKRSWSWMALAAFLISVLAFAAACGGDDDGGDGDDGGDATATERAGTGDDGGDDDDTGNGDGGDASQDLSVLAADYETFEGYITYEVSGGAAAGLSTMTIYQDGENSRFDIESDDGSIILISTSDGTFFCTEDQCIKYALGDDTAIGFTQGFTDLVAPDTIESDFVDAPNVDYDVSSETIGGLDATCFSASGEFDDSQSGDETSEVCFSNNGALLLRISSTSGEGTYTMEAVEADTSVPSGSFDPPYDVVDLGDLGDLGDLFDD